MSLKLFLDQSSMKFVQLYTIYVKKAKIQVVTRKKPTRWNPAFDRRHHEYVLDVGVYGVWRLLSLSQARVGDVAEIETA